MHMPTYRAILKGDRLEWRGKVPPEIAQESAIPVDVTILRDDQLSVSRTAQAGERMAAALERLAISGVGIEDPVAWQRELRRERPLPGRD